MYKVIVRTTVERAASRSGLSTHPSLVIGSRQHHWMLERPDVFSLLSWFTSILDMSTVTMDISGYLRK